MAITDCGERALHLAQELGTCRKSLRRDAQASVTTRKAQSARKQARRTASCVGAQDRPVKIHLRGRMRLRSHAYDNFLCPTTARFPCCNRERHAIEIERERT